MSERTVFKLIGFIRGGGEGGQSNNIFLKSLSVVVSYLEVWLSMQLTKESTGQMNKETMWLISLNLAVFPKHGGKHFYLQTVSAFVQFCGKAVRRHERCIIVVSIAKQK